MRTLDLKITLSDSEELTLKETNWKPENPSIDYHNSFCVDGLVTYGILYHWPDRSVHLTSIGEEILEKIEATI